MKKVLSALISGMVLCATFPLNIVRAENNEEYVFGDGHLETVDEFSESLHPSLSFNELLGMSDEELINYSEEYASIIEEINLAGVCYERVHYTLCYYNASKYLDEYRLIQKDKLINDLGIPTELIFGLSDIPDVQTVNEFKCDTIRLDLIAKEYSGYSAYQVFRTYELILKANSDIPFVLAEYSGKVLPNTASILAGDVNNDGEFNVADVVTFQKWLLGNDVELKNWKAADLCEDDKLDVFDLCLMKRELVKNMNNTYPVENPEVIDEFTPCTRDIYDIQDPSKFYIVIKCQYSTPDRIWTVDDFNGIDNIKSITQTYQENPYRTILEVKLADQVSSKMLSMIHGIEALDIEEIKEFRFVDHPTGLG